MWRKLETCLHVLGEYGLASEKLCCHDKMRLIQVGECESHLQDQTSGCRWLNLCKKEKGREIYGTYETFG